MQGVSIFWFGDGWESWVDSWWVEAGYETHRVPSYDLDTPSDALDNQIGPSVWPLRCFEVIKPEPQKTEIWEIPVFSMGTFIGSKILHEQATTTPKLDAPEILTPLNFNAPELRRPRTLDNQIGPSVWPLRCSEVYINKTQTSKNGNLGNPGFWY